jgi:hypothetical protein
VVTDQLAPSVDPVVEVVGEKDILQRAIFGEEDLVGHGGGD